MRIHIYKLLFITSGLKLKFRKCGVRRMSTKRCCDLTLLEQAHLYPGLILGLKFVVVFELIGIFKESNVLSFFGHNMRFVCYSAALCIQINRFQSECQA